MDESREESPDWLRSFQPPTKSFLTLSSDSDHSPSCSPVREDDETSQSPKRDQNQDAIHIDSGEDSPVLKTLKSKSPKKRVKDKTDDHADDFPAPKASKSKSSKKRVKVKTDDQADDFPAPEASKSKSPKKEVIVETDNHDEDSLVLKASKSESPKKEVIVETDNHDEDSLVLKASKSKSPKKRVIVEIGDQEEGNDIKGEAMKKENLEKQAESHLSSRMPLVMSEKVQRMKALVECEGESIDMSGDVGAVGRIIVSDTPSGIPEMLFDLKGTIYKTTIVPSRTFCVVSFGQTEAKIEAIMNDFIQLQPQSNVYESETMIEGTLDGFSFDSEDEADRVSKPNAHRSDQNNEGGELTNGKTKADKALGVARKKGKTAAKPPKKGKRKTQAPKKARSSKK